MTYKDNQPTFNVGNRKVVNFKDYLQNKDAEKAKLTKAHLQSKPNSEDQQHPGNTRSEYNPVTHKLTDYSVDEIEDTLDSMEEIEGSLNENNDLLYKEIKGILRDSNHPAESKVSMLRSIADEIESGKKQKEETLSRWSKENERSRRIGGLDPNNKF